MKAIIEVGANNGRDTKRLLREYPNIQIFSFEPVPQLYKQLLNMKLPNVKFINAAVGIKTEIRPFNITANIGNMPPHGSSSLFNFNSDLHNHWPRPDFIMEETIETQVYSLADFIEQEGITEIVHLHCDAQGNDVNVLKGLGKYAPILQTGLIEVTNRLNLYNNNENTYEHAKIYMEENNFEIVKTENNDPLHAELNIWFKRK